MTHSFVHEVETGLDWGRLGCVWRTCSAQFVGDALHWSHEGKAAFVHAAMVWILDGDSVAVDE